jgi:hypothetical protein
LPEYCFLILDQSSFPYPFHLFQEQLHCLSQKTVQTLAAHGIKLVVQLAAGSQYHLAKRLENVGFDTIRHIADSLKERLDIALPSYTPQEERRIRWEIENEWS